MCVFSHCFSNFFDWFCVIFWLRSHLFTPDPAKSQETLKLVADWALLSAAECCWEIQFPSFFPFFVCVFLLFCPEFIVSPICLMDFVLFFGFVLTFSTLTLQKVRKLWNWLQIEHCWVLLSAAECAAECCWEIQFQAFFHLFCVFLMDFALFFGFVLTFFTSDPAKNPGNLEIGCRLAECCWVLLSASECCWVLLSVAECCWVLLSAAECCWEIQFPAFFHLFCVCFPIVLSRFHCFFQIVWWILPFFWLRSHLFHPWPWKKSGNLEIGCRLSSAECCWVLLSAAECCWEIQFPSFLYLFCVCFPIVLSRFHCFSKLFEWIWHFFWLRSHLFHPWPWKKSGNLEIGCRLSTAECCWVLRSVLLSAAEKSNSKPFSICFVCVFPLFWWILRFFLASFSPFSPLTLQKVRKPWNWLQIEHCWVLLSAAECCWVLLSAAECCWEIQFPSFFPFFVCVFLLFCPDFIVSPIWLMDFVLFLASFSPFQPWPCKKSGNLEIVADWALLSAAERCWVLLGNPIPILFPFFLSVFFFCFVQSSLFLQFFWWILCFFGLRSQLFHPWSCKKSGNLEIGCRLSTAECCWVLLGNQIPILFVFVLCVFSHCFVQISLSFQFFDGFCIFFCLRSHLFHPWPCKKSGNLEIGCRLSTAECYWVLLCAAECCWVLLGNPIPSLFPFVLCVFSHCFVQISLFFPDCLNGFCIFFGFVLTFFIPDPGKSQETLKLVAEWALLSAAECVAVCCWEIQFPTFFHLFCVCVCSHCFCPDFIVFPQFLMDFVVFVGFVFSSFTRKNSGNLEISCRLSTAEHCWEMQSPAFFHLFCWSFHGFCHSFWWVLIRKFLQSFPCFSSWNLKLTSISIAFSMFFRFLMDFALLLLASFSHLSPWPCQKRQETLKLVADWALLSTAEKCNPQPVPFVLLKFSWLLPQFLIGFDFCWASTGIGDLISTVLTKKRCYCHAVIW